MGCAHENNLQAGQKEKTSSVSTCRIMREKILHEEEKPCVMLAANDPPTAWPAVPAASANPSSGKRSKTQQPAHGIIFNRRADQVKKRAGPFLNASLKSGLILRWSGKSRKKM